jgi:hypothetical protein
MIATSGVSAEVCEELWKHVQRAISKATDKNRKCPPTEMFVFVREMMSFQWAEAWRHHPARIAELLEEIDTKRFAKYFRRPPERNFWESTLKLSGGRDEFVALWLCMRFPPGQDPLLLARHDALHELWLSTQAPTSFEYEYLLSIAYHLQQRAGDRDILLPQARLAELLKVSQRTVSSYLDLARRNRLLRVIARYNYAAKKATLYRFAIDRFDPMTGEELTQTSGSNAATDITSNRV